MTRRLPPGSPLHDPVLNDESLRALTALAKTDALAAVALLPPARAALMLRSLTEEQHEELRERWPEFALEAQKPPEHDDWRVWLIRAGRGFGKTRAGAEWISAQARAMPQARIALVGASFDDVRTVMIEGQSGLIAVARDEEEPRWRATAGELHFPSGACAYVYSAEAPERLRGPEHHLAWCDEIAKWRYGDAAWDNLMLGLRLGDRPRVVVTTTPKPVTLMRRVMAIRGVAQTHGATHENPHLPAAFLAAMEEQYGGTRLGRQELDGELIDDVPGALWTRDGIEALRVAVAPALVRVVVAVDPPATSTGDACGIVAAGLGRDDHVYVIEDASVAGLSPAGWARAVAACARRVQADRIIAEVNQGGDMVIATLKSVDDTLPVFKVHASRGKALRAEPVAARYEQGRVHHVGAFPALEDQLCGIGIGGDYAGPGRSPDRADALVWAVGELALRKRPRAAVRGL